MYCIKYVTWYLEKNYSDPSMILIIVIDFVNTIMYEFLSCSIGQIHRYDFIKYKNKSEVHGP